MEHHSDTNMKYGTESDQTFGAVDNESLEEIDTNIVDSEEEMAYDLIGSSPNFVADFTETAEEDDPVIKQWINDVGDVYDAAAEEDIKDEESGPIEDDGDTESLAVSVPCEEQTDQCEREEIVDSEDDMASISDIMKSSYDSITELLDSEEERDEIVESDEELSPVSDLLKSSNESIDQLLENLSEEELSINDDHVFDPTEQIESDMNENDNASSETEPWQFDAPEQMIETESDSASTLPWEDIGDNTEEERDKIVESDEELSPVSDLLKSSNESIDQLLENLSEEELSISDDHVIYPTEQIKSDMNENESASSETEPWQFDAPEQMNETVSDSASTLSWEDIGDNTDRHSTASSSAFEDPVNIEYEINGDEEPDECTICLDELQLEICCFIDPCGHKGYLHDNNTFL